MTPGEDHDATAAPRPGNVLAVDDNSINRYLLIQQVTKLGHRVAAAGDGREALAMLRAQPFDLVLLDIVMPEMDGHAVLERMKADPDLREIPVIMASGLEEIQSVIRCIEAGAEDFLPKPVDPVLLRARINACLEKKRLRDVERKKTRELEIALDQLKATQAQLIMQEKLASLGALTAGIAHEIKNPLNFAINFSQLLREMMAELRAELNGQRDRMEPPARDSIDDLLANLDQSAAKIHEHARRADSIVRGMLLHSRGQPGERQRADLNALVDQYVSLAYHGLRGQDPSYNVAIETDYDPATGQVEVIPQDLSRVILNVANNAFYAAQHRTAPGGGPPMVVIRTRDLGDRVEVRIRDNGDGISRAHLDKLFHPFFTTKPPGVGTGLGLSISYDIVVQRHRGEMRVETEEGRSCEFIVVLPRAA